jgi:hypothetical protein
LCKSNKNTTILLNYLLKNTTATTPAQNYLCQMLLISKEKHFRTKALPKDAKEWSRHNNYTYQTIEDLIIATMSVAQAGINRSASDKKEVFYHRSLWRLMAFMGGYEPVL